MQVHRIFVSISGEQNAFGIGYPSVFVRFYGCKQNCKGCDTPQAMNGGIYEDYTPESLFKKVKEVAEKHNLGLITLTGGEPLEQPTEELLAFIELCKEEGLFLSIETNGMESIEPYLDFPNINFVVDWKLPYAGLKADEYIITKEFGMLGDDDYIKLVIKDELDFSYAKLIIEKVRESDCKTAIGLHSHSPYSYQELIDMLTENDLLGDVTINFQSHKLLKLA